MKKIIILFLLTVFIVVLDQLSKYLVFSYFNDSILKNYGIALSIRFPGMAILILTYLLLFVGIIFVYKELDLNKIWAILFSAFVLGGALGNSIDRILNGYVIDFISIWKFPVFNIADIFITTGILGILVFYGKIKKNKS